MPVPILGLAIATTLASLGAVVGVEMATDAPAHASTSITQSSGYQEWYLPDADSCVDAWTMDRNQNGRPDLIWLDLDGSVDGEDCAPDTRIDDLIDYDDLVTRVEFDMNENRYPEVTITQEATLQGVVTTECVDANEDGAPDGGYCPSPAEYTITAPTYDGLFSLVLTMTQTINTMLLR